MGFNLVRALAVGLALMLACAAGSARAEWRRAETTHFIVYGDWSERAIREYAQKIERFDGLLRAYYPIETAYEIPKLEIYLANGQRDMNRVSPGIGGGVAGFYSSNNGRIYAVVDTTVRIGDVVFFHEYAHHFMFQMGSNAYPSWFVEGFAEYYATAEIRPDEISFGRHHPNRMDVLSAGANIWAPMEDLLKWRYTPSGRYPAGLYYAQAWALTHYMMATPERTRMLGQYLAAVTRGEDAVTAMTAATGRTPEQLQGDLRRYLLGRIDVLTPQITIPPAEVAVTTLSPAEVAMIWLDIRLDNTSVKVEPIDDDGAIRRSEAQKARDERERAEERADLIRDSFATAQRFPGNRMAILTAARAHRLSYDPAAALAALEPLVVPASTDADALRIAAMALLDLAATETDPAAALRLRRRANGFLARSMDVEPLDFRTYLGLNEARRGQQGYPNDNDITTLESARALAPQSFETRLRLGAAYASRGLYEEAILTVRPVANSPHRSGYTRRAREMIAAAQTAQGKPVEAFEDAPEEEGEAAPAAEAAPAE